MNLTRRAATLGGLSFLTGASAISLARADEGFVPFEGIEDFVLATDAYVFGYPLVTMEMTRRVMTNVSEVKGTRGPMGQIVKLRHYPDATFRDVTAPNADTLYTTAWIRCRRRAMGSEHPRHEGPLFPVADARRLDEGLPGSRQAHDRHGRTDLRHHRTGMDGLAASRRQGIQSPTSLVWMLGRIYCTGTPEDYAAVHKPRTSEARSAQLLRQALYAAPGRGRSLRST